VRTTTLLISRPVPGRLIPALGGAVVILIALPLFLLMGWDVRGWALAAVLWTLIHALDLVLARLRTRTGNLAASVVHVSALLFKSLGLLIVLFATVSSHPQLALGAVLVYALAYTFELGLSLLAYYGMTP
jgi:hypothetical protein